MKSRFVFVTGCAAVLAVGFSFWLFHPSSTQRAAATSATLAQPPPVPPPVPAAPAMPSATAAMTNSSARPRESDPRVNPYATSLRAPGKSKRAWDVQFLQGLANAAGGDPIRFELTEGRVAAGTIRITQFQDGRLTYVSGELTQPEAGKFFFLEPPAGGKAGKAVGVVELAGSRTAYRIEPTGPNGDPELWQRRMEEVLCVDMPQARASDISTNEVAELSPPLRPDAEALYGPSYNSNIVSLQSYPGSRAVLLLDFFGGYTATWGGIAYSKPANVSNTTIKDLWKRVAEDYMPFNINVTTDIKVYLAAPANSRQRCCFTDTKVTGAGVAYIGSWNWGNDTPCWSVYNTGKNGAEVGSHEPGHTLGLGHQGSISSTATNEYYGGQGSGATGWAPIMGVGYYKPVTTWAKGEYQYANNTEDELTGIVTENNNVTYRPDDTGETLATSRYLEVETNGSAWAEGVIERTDDTDAFQFTTTGGEVFLTANPVNDWANLAMTATLADEYDNVIAGSSGESVLTATISTYLAAGTYTFRVTGAGRNDPYTDGFSSYGSLGYYSIAGRVAGGRAATRLSVMEQTAVGTAVGSVPAGTTSDLLAYAIVGGNSNSTFSINASGVVSVANSTLLNYTRLATNTMLAVQFELLVNITNLSNPDLTELKRRVVIAVLQQGQNYPIEVTGLNASVIVPNNATLAGPQATAFDLSSRWCFYEAGLNASSETGGTGAYQGFPPSRTILSQVDGSVFQLGPYGQTNTLMLSYTYPRTATLPLKTPRAYNSLAILASSANGGGNGSVYVTFTNGTRSPTFAFYAQDWFNTITNVAAQGFGRLRLGQTTLYTENPGWSNPNLYQTTLNLAALGLNQPVASITFIGPSGGSTLSSAIFALSGALMPPAVNIVQHPQPVTNSVPSTGATFNVVAMGSPPLAYQWYFSATGTAGTFAPLAGQTATNLVLGAVLDATNAGSYYVVVTNSVSAATSSVAKLTLFRAPVIVAQPNPTNLFRFAGQSASFSVAANAAVPVYYYWTTNGGFLPGPTAATLTLSSLQPSNSANYTVVVSNAYGMATSGIASLTVLAAPTYPLAQAILADRAMSYWRLDEKSGTIAHDYVGTNNGYYNYTLLGQAGYNLLDTHTSARFGYLASSSSYVYKIPINFATTTSAVFSVEAWVNGGTQSGDNGLVTKGTGGGGEQFNLDCGGGSQAFRFFVRDITGAAHLATSGIVPNSKWHHLVGICDQVNSNILLYVDSTNCYRGSITTGSGILSSTNLVTFGSRQSGTTSYNLQFTGYMEEIAIYSYALSSNQVRAHFLAATNRAPVFAVNPFTAASVNAGKTLSFSIATNAADPNGDSMTFSKVSGPAWLGLLTSGTLYGTPATTDSGTNSFVISVRDTSGLSNTATMFLLVNGAPAFTSNPFTAPPATVGRLYSATLADVVTDPNTDTLAFAKVGGPAWLSVGADGALSGTPAAADLGDNTFQVSVTDPGGLSASAAMHLTVQTPPTLRAALAVQGSDLVLNWSGASGPFQVQWTTNLANPVWINLGDALTATNLVLTPSNDAAFYRILCQ